jgi:hypothetical protein
MKKLSAFDIGMIVAFVLIGLLGGAAWWYLAGQLETTQQTVGTQSSDFDKYSSKEVFLPTANNVKTLQDNIDVMKAQLDPLIAQEFQAKGNGLASVEKVDTVTWKSDLDRQVGKLNASAKAHNVVVPANFYYGFSRYLNTNPTDEQIVVLSKQLLGVVEMANILIDAPVRGISTFRRTYEEDEAASGAGAPTSRNDTNLLEGRSVTASRDVYTAYPFEVEIDTSTVGLRALIDGLQKSPYVFVVRSMVVINSSPLSPQLSDLDKMAGTDASAGANPVTDTSPGAVATAAPPARGPQYLFGNETLHVKIRIDLIEWKGIASSDAPATENGRTGRNGRDGRPGGGRSGGTNE